MRETAALFPPEVRERAGSLIPRHQDEHPRRPGLRTPEMVRAVFLPCSFAFNLPTAPCWGMEFHDPNRHTR